MPNLSKRIIWVKFNATSSDCGGCTAARLCRKSSVRKPLRPGKAPRHPAQQENRKEDPPLPLQEGHGKQCSIGCIEKKRIRVSLRAFFLPHCRRSYRRPPRMLPTQRIHPSKPPCTARGTIRTYGKLKVSSQSAPSLSQAAANPSQRRSIFSRLSRRMMP